MLKCFKTTCLHEGQQLRFWFQLLSRCFYSFTTTFQTAQQPEFQEGNNKQTIAFPQNERHMRVSISAALAQNQRGSALT